MVFYVHEMLEFVFGNAYFTFDNCMYLQLVGLFMGCKPSPLGAITRVYMFERRSIYIDPHFLPITSLLYGRYVDDSGTLAKTRDQSNQMFSSIASQDPDRRLGLRLTIQILTKNGPHFLPLRLG